jgi:hypothetical protein
VDKHPIDRLLVMLEELHERLYDEHYELRHNNYQIYFEDCDTCRMLRRSKDLLNYNGVAVNWV